MSIGSAALENGHANKEDPQDERQSYFSNSNCAKQETLLLEPYSHIVRVSGKNIRQKLIHGFNQWMNVGEDKIAAIGVKLRKWVSFHGISLNVEPDLGHFSGIVPCGQTEHGVTSLVDLGLPVTMDEADAALRASFQRVFGPVEDASAPI